MAADDEDDLQTLKRRRIECEGYMEERCCLEKQLVQVREKLYSYSDEIHRWLHLQAYATLTCARRLNLLLWCHIFNWPCSQYHFLQIKVKQVELSTASEPLVLTVQLLEPTTEYVLQTGSTTECSTRCTKTQALHKVVLSDIAKHNPSAAHDELQLFCKPRSRAMRSNEMSEYESSIGYRYRLTVEVNLFYLVLFNQLSVHLVQLPMDTVALVALYYYPCDTVQCAKQYSYNFI